ncbi:MAG: pyridoxal phosphate-dependent aminotransferase, partial [Acidobacteriota bacterium]
VGRSINESATLMLNETAAVLRAKGEPVIHLGGGEPKSKAPQEAVAAAAELVKTGEVRYTPADGTPQLKKAIIRYTHEFYGRKVEPANVIASGGAKQALMVALQAILDPKDEVVYPAPYWVSYPEMVAMTGAVAVPALPADESFYPRLQDIERHVTPKTKAVIINSPSNPSGAMYPEQFIAEIVEFCEKRGLFLIMDDIYHRLIFDGLRPISCYRFAGDLSEQSRLIVINGVSKQYAMTGFRIGWAVASRPIVRAMVNIQSHQTSGPSTLGQVAAAAALNGDQSSVESLRATLESNRNLMLDRLRGIQGVVVNKPEGTFYCFVNFRAFDKDSTRLSRFLLEKARVVTVPGIEFGLDGYLRLSTCGSAQDITEGVDRIKWALDPNSPREIRAGDRKLVKDW